MLFNWSADVFIISHHALLAAIDHSAAVVSEIQQFEDEESVCMSVCGCSTWVAKCT